MFFKLHTALENETHFFQPELCYPHNDNRLDQRFDFDLL